MIKYLNFFLEIDKLKKMRKKGWIWRGVKNSETMAQHTFRVALMNWFLAKEVKPRLNLEKVIKASLVHDLCEVYAGDMTPRWGLLPKDPKKRKEFLKKRVRLPKELREKRWKIKFKKEKESLEKLIKNLEPQLGKEIMDNWLDCEVPFSREGRFTRQGDKVEPLIQAIEYFGPKPMVTAWWEEMKDSVDHPVLTDFLKEIEEKFYTKSKKTYPLLDFITKIGMLKFFPRRSWVFRGIKNPETIADHSFMVALMVWVLGRDKKINMEKALKIALIHEICVVYAGDYTPHDTFASRPLVSPRYDILGPRWRWRKFWQEQPKLLRNEKAKRFLRTYEKETKALQKLIKKLPEKLKQEILELWKEFNEKETRESNFVDQVNCLATFLQACQYWQEDKSISIKAFGEQVAKFISEPELIEFLKAIKRKFKLKS